VWDTLFKNKGAIGILCPYERGAYGSIALEQNRQHNNYSNEGINVPVLSAQNNSIAEKDEAAVQVGVYEKLPDHVLMVTK
jgi:hypothetical protein